MSVFFGQPKTPSRLDKGRLTDMLQLGMLDVAVRRRPSEMDPEGASR